MKRWTAEFPNRLPENELLALVLRFHAMILDYLTIGFA